MPEYRPCIVTEAVWSYTSPQTTVQDKKHNATFHCWAEHQNFYNQPFPVANYYSQPYLTRRLMAVVEYEDGTIHEVAPQQIQFTDCMAEKFSKNKKDDWRKLTEDTDSYPEFYDKVLFKTSDGRIFYGCCGVDLDWSIEIEEDIVKIIKNVVEWRYL